MAPHCEPIGSDGWTRGAEYEEEYAARIQYFKKAFNAPVLLAHVSSIRDGVQCRLHDRFAVGSFNFVKKITFDDGVDWIARLRLPPIEHFDAKGFRGRSSSTDALETNRVLSEMKSELDTMEFVRAIFLERLGDLDLNNGAPHPRTNLDWDNDVGFPYSFIQHVHGSTAGELAATFPGDHEGIPEQYISKSFQQISSIMHQLANIRMPKIGSLIRSASNPKDFQVGPLIETNSGPYDSTADFYKEYPIALARIQISSQVAKEFGTGPPCNVNGFGLANYDLGPHNIIVDREFNVLAVIDWDTVFAAPDAVLFRLPFLMGISSTTPGVVEKHPACKAREQRGLRFAEIVEKTSSEMVKQQRLNSGGGKCEDVMVLTKQGFYSKEAVAFRALIHFKMRQDWVDEEWAMGLKWLVGKSEAETLDFYLRST